MLTDLQRKKLPKMFALNDTNGDGVITREDFEQAVREIAHFRGLAAGTSGYAEMEKTVMSRWETIRERCDADGDDRVTLEEWLADWEAVLATEGEYERVGKPISVAVARSLDVDGDGRISSAEYTQWLGRWGIEEKVALDCFARLDRDGDGQLSVDDFVALVAEFFQSSDPSSPGNWLLGPPDAMLRVKK